MVRWIFFVMGIFGLAWNVCCQNVTQVVPQTETQPSSQVTESQPESHNVTSSSSKYENYTLLRVYPTKEEQISVLAGFHDPDDKVEVLKLSRGLNDSADILVPPEKLDFVNQFVATNGLFSQVKDTNYGRRLEMSDRLPRRRQMGNSIYQYNSEAGIQEIIQNIAREHPELVKVEYIGSSFEGRRMNLVKISTNFQAKNPVILIDAGIHAREWVAPAMAVYLIHRLVYDPEARKRELNGVDFYILPLANPDGYEFSRSRPENRMWRKTMSRNQGCIGVDGNRNYGFKWAVSGVSMDPCDKETYAGSKPFSEKETQNVKKVMMQYKDCIKLYVSIHSYGQYLVYPWGYTGAVLPPVWKKLDSFAKRVSAAVVKAGGDGFKVLSAGKWYPAAGGSDDFAFGAVGIPYSYTMELTDGYEFAFPQELLKSTFPKLYHGFRAMSQQIQEEFSS